MKLWNQSVWAAPPRDTVLPRSVGVLIAAMGALFCWAVVIAVAHILT
jgi:hypothetical protein